MVFTGPPNEPITQGKTYTFKIEDSTFTIFTSGVFAFIVNGGDQDETATINFDVREFGRNRFDFIPGQPYEGTIGAPVAGAPMGPYMTASTELGQSCNDDARTTGRFEMGEYEWQVVYFPAGSVLDEGAGPIGFDRQLSFAVTRFQVEFEIRCNGSSSAMTGTLDFYGERGPVPTSETGVRALEVIGPTDICFDPLNVGTGTACSGNPGSGEGPGGGTGTVFPTFPPPPPPPDVTIALPPVISEAPSLQLTNNSSTSFTFFTTPGGSVNSDVHLSVTSDANEADNFKVTVTPEFIPAPGTGQATVNISVGPDTFPRRYLVTLSALANGKTHAVVIIVDVACDPPQILGVDQPRNQQVNRGSTATVEVKATGSGPFNYQWYSGRRGSTTFPVAGATNPTFTTPAVQGTLSYWVRVSNACGTVDSNTVTVSPL
ncbi:MAG TPA: hypothetical protein VMS98_14820 [Thermoanaerobaculia bacterium]|nr:hypothetical protein [Thermoanaerobaculia bacterium]